LRFPYTVTNGYNSNTNKMAFDDMTNELSPKVSF